VPVAAAPLEHGAVLVGEDGRIVAAGPDADVPSGREALEHDLGQAILLPGLVNVHAHLELTALRGLVRVRPFPLWVRAIRVIKDALGPDDFRASARWGALECLAAGITCVGDTGSSLEPARALAALGLRGIAFHEVFGPDPTRCAESLRGLDESLAALAPCESERVAVGISPHAPYTVSEPLLRSLGERALAQGRPVAMHLAESAEEQAFVRSADGAFAARHRERGIPVGARGLTPIQWALRSGLGPTAPLCIHCVHADAADRRELARHHASVAHCPWSNVLLGTGSADLAALRQEGLAVGLGTDSVAAGGALDLFTEGRLAAASAALTPHEVVRMLTVDGAAALGVEDVGELVPGAWADLVALATDRPALAAIGDPEETVALHASPADVTATWVGGVLRYDRGRWPSVNEQTERTALTRAAGHARAAAAAG
jgi:5-methylthioadenosine/S-adenosylhomocysteine deaminase